MVSRIQQEIKQNRPFPSRAEEAVVALMRTADLVRRTVAAIVEPYGITPQQYNVLRILRGAGQKGLPTLEIADRMIEQMPGITRLIDRLEKKNFVCRERCATDRRQVFCKITKQGLTIVGQLDAPILAGGDAALAALPPRQLAQLIVLLDKTRNGLSAAVTPRRSKNQIR